MVRIPTHREPTHPGEMLREEFLKPMGLSQSELAEGIRVPYQRVNELVNGKRGVTPGTALRLAKYFGTSAGFWKNLRCGKVLLAKKRQLVPVATLERNLTVDDSEEAAAPQTEWITPLQDCPFAILE